MEYTKLLREAYYATFEHKRMWWLGMAVLTGSGLGFRIFSNGAQYLPGALEDATGESLDELFADPVWQQWWSDSWWILFIALGCLFLFWIVALLIHLVAQSGLYYGAEQARLGKPVLFGAMCRVGVTTIGRYFGFYILLALMRFIAGLAFLIAFITLAASLVGLVFAVPLLFVTLLTSWAIALLVEVFVIYCLQGMTLRQYSSIDTFRYAWKTLQTNWLNSLLMAGVMLLIALVIGLASFCLYLILLAPFAILAYVAYTSEAWLMFGLSLAVGSLVIMAVWLTLKGMIQSFYVHVWHRVYASF